MKLDRQYQNDLLTFLLNDYPGYEKASEYCDKLQKEDEDKYMANVCTFKITNLSKMVLNFNSAQTGELTIDTQHFHK